jgi:hypothetical protein
MVFAMEDGHPPALQLTCHPWAPDPWVRGVEVSAIRDADGVLRLTYILIGRLGHLRLPKLAVLGGSDHLWQHTCFEAFIAIQGESAYHECNFAPSGEWAAHAFREYREREDRIVDLDPCLHVNVIEDRLAVEATVPLDSLSPRHRKASLRLALSAVIEDESGVLSYWALRHPPGRPDFHHVDAFALDLDAP